MSYPKEVVTAWRQVIRNGMIDAVIDKMTANEKKEFMPMIEVAFAQEYHLKFIQYTWQQSIPFKVGLHTWLVCHEIDKAMEKFRNGISSNVAILIPFRHGKSNITTRFFPAHFLAEFPEKEVIVNSHSTKNTAKFSRFGRALIRSKKFQELYPYIEISKENAGVEEWGIEGGEGLAQYFGILSGSSGTGAALLVTDDFFGGREDAESSIMRDKVDEAYRENIFTRRADPSINLITVTPWHTDDLIGRIEKRMKIEDKSTRYRIIRMPYKEPNNETIKMIQEDLAEETDEKLKSEMKIELERYANGGYLFPKMFSNQWYVDMETSLGGATGYGTQSLMRCQPKTKCGNELKTENVKILKPEKFFEESKGLRWIRIWDLASSIKQINKSDPDYTVGIKMAVRHVPTSIQGATMAQLYIADIVRGRWEVTRRNQTILDTAINDGLIKVYVEAVTAYKDAYIEVKNLLRGVRYVEKIPTKWVEHDKHSKGSILVPIFDSGNVFLLEGPWNNDFLNEAAEWPDGSHDDQIDPLAAGVHIFSPVKTGFQYDDRMIV